MDLQAALKLQRQIEAEEKYLAAMQAQATAPRTSKIDGLPHGQSTASRVEAFAALVVDSEHRLNDLREELACAMIDLVIAIGERVPSPLPRNVLVARYVDLLEFKAIAAQMNFSESNVYRLHRQGVKMWQAAER